MPHEIDMGDEDSFRDLIVGCTVAEDCRFYLLHNLIAIDKKARMILRDGRGIIVFNNKDDAIMFKLQW